MLLNDTEKVVSKAIDIPLTFGLYIVPASRACCQWNHHTNYVILHPLLTTTAPAMFLTEVPYCFLQKLLIYSCNLIRYRFQGTFYCPKKRVSTLSTFYSITINMGSNTLFTTFCDLHFFIAAKYVKGPNQPPCYTVKCPPF